MRSLLRFILTFLSSVVVASFILCILFPEPITSGDDPDRGPEPGNLGDWLSFRDPASLFSPTATISLTDDNSTFFNAKPAAFGPSLPIRGLSGQVWVGSGFGDDNVNRRGMAATVEGELGCGDIPGWKGSSRQISTLQYEEYSQTSKVSSREPSGSGRVPRVARRDADSTRKAASSGTHGAAGDDEDGTDDHLHYPLIVTAVSGPGHRESTQSSAGSAARQGDIQSLQEAAEIAGKVVLLSRGGCGFAEKVKWAQRRGAIAVIVADNVRGGPLVRMYARGDLSNITIPSLFTSHTTAHLLSHLIPPITDLENGKQSNIGQGSTHFQGPARPVPAGGNPATEYSTTASKPTNLNLPLDSTVADAYDFNNAAEDTSSLEDKGKSSKWLTGERFNDDAAKEAVKSAALKTDGFLIGKQDWRDPDIVQMSEESLADASRTSPKPHPEPVSASVSSNFRGGSITPGSGEYEQPGDRLVDSATLQSTVGEVQSSHQTSKRRSWLVSLLFGDHSKSQHEASARPKVIVRKPSTVKASFESSKKPEKEPSAEDPERHVGLWVTLTPTDLNASPFLNTLFVLVISPLITLAVVYSMLLLRSRIRRRRWRAPKSVVDRLPVRVYTTLSSRSTSGTETPVADATSETPLLSPSSRPRDVTASTGSAHLGIAEGSSLPSSSTYGSVGQSSIDQEKVATGLAEWRRKYGGRQKECVVCLEEYIDGVSRVMSLPCGHEFHADCITPWLTTRRRTCPICKGDVVRSLHQNTAAPRLTPLTEEEVQQQAAERQNTSPSASMPVPDGLISSNVDADVERAEYSSSYSDAGSPQSTWLSRSVNRSLDYFGVSQNDREVDRNR